MADPREVLVAFGPTLLEVLTTTLSNSSSQVFNVIAPVLKDSSFNKSNNNESIVNRIKSVGLLISRKHLLNPDFDTDDSESELDSFKRPKVAEVTEDATSIPTSFVAEQSKTLDIRDNEEEFMDYVQDIVYQYTDLDFKSNFRLSRTSVEVVVTMVGPYLKMGVGRPTALRTESLVLLSLWLLGSQESFKKAARRFHTGQGNAYRGFSRFCTIVSSHSSDFIEWPQGNQIKEVAKTFSNLNPDSPFPNVVGCVDCTHIRMKSPAKEFSGVFCNQKGFHSTILQAVCDSDSRFTNVFCGSPGSLTDEQVWKSSPIYEELSSDTAILPPEYHLLGDWSQPIDSFIMTPYEDNCFLSPMQENYNSKLISLRMVIKKAFGMLKGRFRKLKFFEMRQDQSEKQKSELSTERISAVIMTACVLHNICINNNDDCLEIDLEDEQEWTQHCCPVTQEGLEKRDAIALQMF